MRSRSTLIPLVAMLATPALAAPSMPTYLPTRDVAVTYRVTAKDQKEQQVVARWSAEIGRARIEGGQGYLLADPKSRQATMVMQKVALELPGGERGFGYLPGAEARFTRGGGETVAGLRCTDWQASSARGTAAACITEDGVVLRGQATDKNGHGGAIEALSVTYEPQSAQLFELPPGVLKLHLPAGGRLDPQMLKR